jgi:hypothetical protein
MTVVLTSIGAILLAVLVNVFVVPLVLRAAVAMGQMVSGETTSGGGETPAFVAMLTVLLAWAYGCFFVGDWLAAEEFGQRWVLLFVAAALAGGPYLSYQRRVDNNGIGAMLVPPLHSALQYAGGIQSKVVFIGMLSGIYFDWWEYLPG